MRWRLIPVYADGKGRPRMFAFTLVMFGSESMTDTQMYAHRQEAERWCHEQFAYGSWGAWAWDFEFMNHADAVAFKVRWG